MKAKRERTVAEGLLKGRTSEQMADELGVTRRTVEAYRTGEACTNLVEGLYQKHREELQELFARALRVCGDAMEATELGCPAHEVRLQGVRELRGLLNVGAKFAGRDREQQDGRQVLEWEQIELIEGQIRARRVRASAPNGQPVPALPS